MPGSLAETDSSVLDLGSLSYQPDQRISGLLKLIVIGQADVASASATSVKLFVL